MTVAISHRFGYENFDTTERPPSEKSFAEAVDENGHVFSILFYILLLLYVLPLFAQMLFALVYFNPISALLSGAWLLVPAYMILRHNLYGLIILILSPMFMIYLILAILSLPFMNPLAATAVYSLALGILGSFLLTKVSLNSGKLLRAAITLSVFFAVAYPFLALVSGLIGAVKVVASSLPVPPQLAELISKLPTAFAVDPAVAFLIAVYMFNAPFLIAFFRRPDRQYRFAFLYFIPLGVYVGMAWAVRFILSKLPGGA